LPATQRPKRRYHENADGDRFHKKGADWVDAYPTRKGISAWWRAPLLVSATIDKRFKVLPEIAAPNHLLPNDLLQTARSVIVFFLPFKRALVAEKSHGKFPVRNWSLAYNDTNILKGYTPRTC